MIFQVTICLIIMVAQLSSLQKKWGNLTKHNMVLCFSKWGISNILIFLLAKLKVLDNRKNVYIHTYVYIIYNFETIQSDVKEQDSNKIIDAMSEFKMNSEELNFPTSYCLLTFSDSLIFIFPNQPPFYSLLYLSPSRSKFCMKGRDNAMAFFFFFFYKKGPPGRRDSDTMYTPWTELRTDCRVSGVISGHTGIC